MKYLPIIFIFLASTVASAQQREVDRFRSATLQIIDNAQHNGTTEVQGIRLSDLKSFVENAPIYYYKNVSVTFGSRQCAMWQSRAAEASPIILLNKQCTALSDEDLGAIGLHENIGLAYGRDRNYEISTEILRGKISTRKIIQDQLQEQKTKPFDLKKVLENGGSTGVGGGGDFYDLHFKLEGLKYLKENKYGFVDGIPVELLEIALKKMKIKPASNIEGLIEFRGAGVEGPESVAYIFEKLYRNRNYENLGKIAVMAARLYVLYSSDEIGWTQPTSSESSEKTIREAPGLTQAILMMPTVEGEGVVTWVNTALKNSLPDEDFTRLLQSEQLRIQAIIENSEYQKLFQMYMDSTRVRLAR